LQLLANGIGRHSLDRGNRGVADRGDRGDTGAYRSSAEMNRAGAAQTGATAEFRTLQIEFVAQHPKKRHLAIDINRPLLVVNLDRKSHGSHSSSGGSRCGECRYAVP
jgi:hypothetical protein